MRKVIMVLVGVIAATALAGCDPYGAPSEPEVITATFGPGSVTVREGEEVGNIDPPTQLNVIMKLEGDPVQRCLDMGGTFNGAGAEPICEDVDY